jgi:hypothetical protein
VPTEILKNPLQIKMNIIFYPKGKSLINLYCMKYSVVALFCASSLFFGCKETAPNIRLVEPPIEDTVYFLSTPPPTQDHNVLIEELTGAKCSNCPAAHEMLQDLSASNPGRMNVIALYQLDNPLTVPPHGSVNDFRTKVANDIASFVSGSVVSILPNAFVDRSRVNGNFVVPTGDWAATINSQKTKTDSVNLDLTSSYNATENTATIRVIVTYTKNVSTKQSLHVAVVEDHIIDVQEFPFGAFKHDYHFSSVLRENVSSVPAGDVILDSLPVKTAGTVLDRIYRYKPKTFTPAVKLADCRVIAYVTSSDKHVMQSKQAKLAP